MRRRPRSDWRRQAVPAGMRIFVALVGAASGFGCGSPADLATTEVEVGAEQEGLQSELNEQESARPYAIVALPDTQYYAAKYPAIFQAQTNWIVEQRRALNIAFVVHEGDLVDADEPAQWNVASESMDILADGHVPYVVSMGNHDYAQGPSGWPSVRSTLIDQYFPVSRFSGHSWFRGTFDPAHIENNYAVLRVPHTEMRWLVVSLEFGPRDEVLAWADAVLKAHAHLPAIVVTHAYLYEDGTRYDDLGRPGQKWNPHRYPIANQPGAVNDGEEIWQKLVATNPNVKLVLCGHVLGRGTARLTSTRPDGTIVHQILANYQMLAQGGGGYLRLLTFLPEERLIHVSTYSPYARLAKLDPENDFDLPY